MPTGFEEIQHQELSRLFGRMVWARLLLIPVLLALLCWAAFTDPAPWRRLAAAPLALAISAFVLFEVARYERRGFDRRSIPANLSVAVAALAAVCVVTGGLQSPVIPVLFPVATFVGMFLAPRLAAALLAAQVAFVWGLWALQARTALGAALPLRALEAPRDPATRLLATALFTSLALLVGALFARAARCAFDAMLRRALAAQEEWLRAHADRAEELTALSGEIAHELKNPLASVKGLAGLLAQGAPPGKPAERLAVLRREVDRMQVILDEFLNFSRPVVPLTLAPVELGALCREVAALHEGLAGQRGVRLAASGQAVARCDGRKVKQVIVNLLQNALEASPAGAEVALAASAEGGEAVVRVSDRGPGPDPALSARLFEPGVTTKASGSGLGLTIARALARQHGGELALRPRPGGGAEAELRLPAGSDREGRAA
ncbi:sensor histidine kinase [Anaeromyxobacter paludicola]|uniref:sensor histidine kinase n=1 Tax=Anaeromyxobacter paludicola TaxID=2918171 RepID=UPI0020BDA224|nr:HAMP domain-containing sensor histidine kinase [Anaeromyxobacter paludicola]